MNKWGFLKSKAKGILRLGLLFCLTMAMFFVFIPSRQTSAQAMPTVHATYSPLWSRGHLYNIGDTATFTASVTNSTGQPLSYYFWADCQQGLGGNGYSSMIDVINGGNLCGNPTTSSVNVNSTTWSFTHKFTSNDIEVGGIAYPIVAVEQNNYWFANDNAPGLTIFFNLPSLTPTPTPVPATPTPTPSVTSVPVPRLVAALGGTTAGVVPFSTKFIAYAISGSNSGNFNYYFYCNSSDAGTDTASPAPFETDLNLVLSQFLMTKECSYTTAGTYWPKVIIKQGSLVAQDRFPYLAAKPPTKITPNLTLNPNPSHTTKTVTLSATGSTNNVVDTINYSFWWNCASTATTYAQSVTDCGDPTGATIGAKFNGLSASTVTKSIQHLYNQVGAYTPKIIIEQGDASVGKSASLQVDAAPPEPTLSVDLNVSPAQSSPGDLVKLKAITSSNIASGNYSYYFWWNCNKPTSDDLSAMETACGDPISVYYGSVALNKDSSATSFEGSHTYAAAGTFYPKALVVHAGLSKTSSATLNVVKPTLNAGLIVNPTTANGSAKQATLTASAGGTATGSVNYTFWWDCASTATTYTQSLMECGDPNNSSKGAKYTVNSNQQTATFDYIQTGTFHPKVVVERGSADPQEARAQIIINALPIPTLNVSIGGVITSAENTLPASTNITVNISGSTTGSTSYKIWWDCQPNTQDFSKLNSLCGDPTNAAKGTVISSADGELSKTVTTSYALSGLRHPFVLAERQLIQAVASTQINIPPVVIPDTLTSSLTLTPSPADKGGLVKISATTQSNNSTGSYNYYFWWDCPDTSSLILRDVIATCGGPNEANLGVEFMGVSNTATSKEVSHRYDVVGHLHPRVFVEHGTVSANSAAELTVNDLKLLLSVIPEPSPSPSPTLSPSLSPLPSPLPSPSPRPSSVPSSSPLPSPIPSPSPIPNPSPNTCQSVQAVFYYSHTYIAGGGVTTLDGYKSLMAGDNSPVFDIYLSTDGGSVYKRIDHDFDPMPGAVLSDLPTPLKSIAQGRLVWPWEKFLKVTHNVQIPAGMITDPSKAKILVYVADNRHYFDPSSLPAGTTSIPSGGQDLGDSFIFNSGASYGSYAGPNGSGDVMDYSDTIQLSNCPPPPGPSPTPGVSATPTPSVTATVSPVTGCRSTINSPTTWNINQNNQSSPTNITWKSNFASTGRNKQASIILTPQLKNGTSEGSVTAAVMVQDTGKYSYSSNSNFTSDARIVLRLDQYEDGNLISSCNKTVAVSVGSGACFGDSCTGTKTANTVLILGALLASIAASLLTGVASMPLLYRAANSAFALFAAPAWPGKTPAWGIAYDAVNKRPIENAIIRVFSEPSGRLKSTIRSNKNGAFGFILPAGKYSLVASKSWFEFPSRLVIGAIDGKFQGVYKGGVFDVSGDGQQKAQVNINIPLDRTTLTTFDIFHVKTLATISRFFQVIRVPIMILGTISVSYLLVTSHRTIDYVIGVLYVGLWALEIKDMIKKRSYGLVRDRMGNPVAMAMIRAFDIKGQLKNTVVTGEDGKFQLNLDPGEYRLDVSRGGFKSVRTQSFRIDKIQDIGRLNLVLEKLSGR